MERKRNLLMFVFVFLKKDSCNSWNRSEFAWI